MRNVLRKVGDYFINLYKAIFYIKDEPKLIPKKETEKRGGLPSEDKIKDGFDVEYIKEIIDRTSNRELQDNNIVQQQFIANRKAINEYKDWYNRLVGYNKPPELLKELIDADLRMDRIEMDRIFYMMYQQDLEHYKTLKEIKKKQGKMFESIESITTPYSREVKPIPHKKVDLAQILKEAKEKLE